MLQTPIIWIRLSRTSGQRGLAGAVRVTAVRARRILAAEANIAVIGADSAGAGGHHAGTADSRGIAGLVSAGAGMVGIADILRAGMI